MTFGKVTIIFGCMFSGKSTELIRLINRHKHIKGSNILVINHASDTRYGENVISSHNKVQTECISLRKLDEIKNKEAYTNSNIIFIEEAQFFSDLYDFVTEAADKDNKTIYVIGLDGDSNRKPFGDILKLVPHAEEVVKLKALCQKCGDGTEAAFTKRIVKVEGQTLVGSNESYIPVCRKHYLE